MRRFAGLAYVRRRASSPARGRRPLPGDAWASYWYNARVYSSDTKLGLRVFKFAYPAAERLDLLNPQTQVSVID